jgi:hypothetical protein
VNADGVLRALVDRGDRGEAGRDRPGVAPVRHDPGVPRAAGLASLAALPSLAPLLDASADPTDAADRVADPEDQPGDEPEDLEGAAEPVADPDESGPDTPEG